METETVPPLCLKSIKYNENGKTGYIFTINKIFYDWKELSIHTSLIETLLKRKYQLYNNNSYSYDRPVIMPNKNDIEETCENVLHMSVCLPCFDEEWCEISGTLRSLAKNILIYRKRPNSSFKLHVTVYIIQDGWKKASKSFKNGITNEFNCPSKFMIDSKFVTKENEVVIFVPDSEIYYPAYNDINEQIGVTFYPIFITKVRNAQKHNSHLHFFSLCRVQKPDFVFLTDCGTLYYPDCLSHLLEYLYKKHTSVIGVTAKQIVMTQTEREDIQEYPYWYRKKRSSLCTRLFRKIYWWLSPAPLQGFEFESSFVLNTSMFNIIGILPVLPGPCQLLWWDHFDNNNSNNDGILDTYFQHLNVNVNKVGILKSNTVLAEDRILSFSMVLRTSKLKTVWVDNATFIYEPMMNWVKLLGQRRRWINGTISTFLYYLMDKKGRDEMVMSGLSDNNYVKKLWIIQLYQSLLQILSPSFFCVALFEAMIKILKDFPVLNRILPSYTVLLSNLSILIPIETIITLAYFGFYITWVIVSLIFGKKYGCCNGNFYNFVMEGVYMFYSIVNMCVSSAILYSIFSTYNEIGPLFYILIFIWVVPFLITFFFSFLSAAYYILYTIPFFLNICQYVCFVPSFALARVFDLSWGNRDSNNAINSYVYYSYLIKTININFIAVLFNFIIVISYIIAIKLYGNNYYIYTPLFVILFFAVIIQIFFTVIYLFKLLFKDCCKSCRKSCCKNNDNVINTFSVDGNSVVLTKSSGSSVNII